MDSPQFGEPPQESSQIAIHAQPPARDRFPVGLIFILAFNGLAILGSIMGLAGPPGVTFGYFSFTGLPALLYSLLQLMLLVTASMGLLRRRMWGRTFAIIWESYSLLAGAVYMSALVFRPDEILMFLDQMTPGGSEVIPPRLEILLYRLFAAFGICWSIAVLLYLVSKKKHFRK